MGRGGSAVPQAGPLPAGTCLLEAWPFGQRVRRKPAVGEGLAERLPQKISPSEALYGEV